MRHSKNYILSILLVLSNLFVHGQVNEDRFNVNHGVSLERVDSSIKSKLQILQFDSSLGIVFPAEYTTTILSRNNDWGKR